MKDHSKVGDDRIDIQFRRRPFLKATGGIVPLAALGRYASSSVSAENGQSQWYSVPLPEGLSDPHEPIITNGDDYGPLPASIPKDEQRHSELEGETIREYVETIVEFSRQSRERGLPLWGRMAGFPGLTNTVNWAADQFREAGIPHVEVQEFGNTEPIWLRKNWEVRILGDDSHGEGSEDIVLESAFPTENTPDTPPDGIVAPPIYVGNGQAAGLHHIDVSGKIAIQHITLKGRAFLSRSEAVAGIERLIDQGAAGVLNIVETSGNPHVHDFGGVEGAPSFNLGGRDGNFLTEVMNRAAEAGTLDDFRIMLQTESEERDNLTAENTVAIIPGEKSNENIIINAHADGYFEGANDNADGLAVQIALARHFSKPANRPDRNLVFVASAGHHTSELHGPENFVAMNPDLIENTVLVLNLEHLAGFDMEYMYQGIDTDEYFPGPEGRGYRPMQTTTGDASGNIGVDNEAPFLEDVLSDGVDRYNLNVARQAHELVPGELGGYSPVDAPRVQMIRSTPMYHTTGDVADLISTPVLEQAAHFFRYFIEEVDAAPTEKLYT